MGRNQPCKRAYWCLCFCLWLCQTCALKKVCSLSLKVIRSRFFRRDPDQDQLDHGGIVIWSPISINTPQKKAIGINMTERGQRGKDQISHTNPRSVLHSCSTHSHTHTHTHTHRMTSLITRTAPGSSCASWVQKPASRTLWSIHCCFQVKDNIDAQKTFQNKKRICNMFSECVRQCLLRAKFYSVPRKLYLCSCNASHVLQCASCFTQFSIKPTHQQHAQDCLLYLQCTTQITVCHTFCSVALQKSLFFIFCCKHQSHKPQRIQI